MQVENTFRWIDRLGVALQESILNIYSPWYMKKIEDKQKGGRNL